MADTPEEAALVGYSVRAKARVLSVRMIDQRTAEVIVDTEPSHWMMSRCVRSDDGQWFESSATGPIAAP
jgi:hypothetical protein